MRPILLALLLSGSLPCHPQTTPTPPTPFGPIPTPRQLAWHAMEFYGFLHFGLNTFTDKEWGYGDESPALFNPSDFDAHHIADIARMAGMRGLILTAKHHDGFCLWPSAYTEHSVKNSPWRSGRGDVVREMADACHQAGLKFGVYLSPWDRNHPQYAQPEYITYYRNQLRELLTQYGPLFAVWFDGANGGDGYYGGARERRQIDNRTYYDWPNTWAIVRQLQPMAVMFSDAGPDMRWVGNERGLAGDPCWATINTQDRYPGGPSDHLNSGERHGTHWIPAECDVSIRPGWFYHPNENSKVKSLDPLLHIYYNSVGRGACLNLNLPPDRRGRIHDNDIAALRALRQTLDLTFATNLTANARITASHTRGNAPHYAPHNLLDHRPDTYWTTDDSALTPTVTLDFPEPVTFNVARLREFIPLGQRIDAFALDQWQNNQWTEFARGTSIGYQRLLRTSPITTTRLRLRITHAAACPALSDLALFLEPKPQLTSPP
jgi:alpha-L-fucosidase